MGQTLTNGVYLPDNGERNCYTGLSQNWQKLDNLIGSHGDSVSFSQTLTEGVEIGKITINGTEISMYHTDYSSKADASNVYTKTEIDTSLSSKANTSDLTTHTSNADIHVTSTDKSTWNGKQSALSTAQLNACNSGITSDKVSQYDGYATSKANDSSVVHTTGNETINGTKTFNSSIIFAGRGISKGANTGFLEFNGGASWGNGGSIVLSGQERSSYPNSVLIATKTDTSTNILLYQNGEFKPNSNNSNDSALGTSSNKWKTINGINPGALSLPSNPEKYSVIVDTTSWQGSWIWNRYSSNSVNGVLMVKLAPSNGCLCIGGGDAEKAILMGTNHPGVTFDEEFFTFPIVANKEYQILFRGTLSSVRFYANAGNV